MRNGAPFKDWDLPPALAQVRARLKSHAEVMRSQDEGLRKWALDPTPDAEAALRDLLTWAYPRIQNKGNRSTRQQKPAF